MSEVITQVDFMSGPARPKKRASRPQAEVVSFHSGMLIKPVTGPVPVDAKVLICAGPQNDLQGSLAGYGVANAALKPWRSYNPVLAETSLHDLTKAITAAIVSVTWWEYGGPDAVNPKALQLAQECRMRGLPVALFDEHIEARNLAACYENISLLPNDIDRLPQATTMWLASVGLARAVENEPYGAY